MHDIGAEYVFEMDRFINTLVESFNAWRESSPGYWSLKSGDCTGVIERYGNGKFEWIVTRDPGEEMLGTGSESSLETAIEKCELILFGDQSMWYCIVQIPGNPVSGRMAMCLKGEAKKRGLHLCGASFTKPACVMFKGLLQTVKDFAVSVDFLKVKTCSPTEYDVERSKLNNDVVDW